MSARWIDIPVGATYDELMAMPDNNTRNRAIAPFYLVYVRDAIMENIPGLTASEYTIRRLDSRINFYSKHVDAEVELFALMFDHDTYKLYIHMYDATICHTHVYWARGLSTKFVPRCIKATRQSYSGCLHIKLAETTTKYEQLVRHLSRLLGVRGLTQNNHLDVDVLAMQLLHHNQN